MKTDANKTDSSPRTKAMDLLARREHSAAEMRAKLLVREFDADEVDLAIERLVADGLLSDARFAEAFVASRIRKGQGPTRIRGELKQRGVAVALIDVQLDRVDVDWTAMARSVREKKFGPERPADYREQAKQSRFLQYRGFSGEQIRHAFEQD